MSRCNSATRNYICMALLFQALAKCSQKGEVNADHLLSESCLSLSTVNISLPQQCSERMYRDCNFAYKVKKREHICCTNLRKLIAQYVNFHANFKVGLKAQSCYQCFHLKNSTQK